MRILNWIYLVLVMVACAACTNSVDDYADAPCIGLNASVGEITNSSRAEAVPYRGSVPTTLNKLHADVWFSTTQGTYTNPQENGEYHVPCHTSMSFDGTMIYALDASGNNLKYNPNKTEVYCVGLYPQSKWTTSNYRTASAIINGIDDLMTADPISGNWEVPLSNLNFKHQLTWLKVCVSATTQDAAAAWGKITKIEVTSAQNAIVDLANGNVTYNGSHPISVLKNNEQSLHTTVQEVGSVLCSPPVKNEEGQYEYSITIVVNGRNITKTIQLLDEDGNPFTEDPKGKVFVIVLFFNKYDVVEGVCTLTAWNDQNEDLYLKPESQSQE